MSNVPFGWQLADLMQTTTSFGGGTPPKAVNAYWQGGFIPWVTPKDMKSFVISASEDHVTEAARDRLSIIPPKSLLLVVRSGILSRTVPVAVTEVPVTINQDMRAFVPEDGVNARFLAWQIIAKEQEVLTSCSKHGTTVASLEAPALARFPLWLAPVSEQDRIVARLEELLSDIDAGVAELTAAQRKLTQYRQSLLKAAVEGALTSEWRASHTPAETGSQLLERILAERRARWETKQLAKFKAQGKTPPKNWQKKYVEPAGPDATTLPEAPVGWTWATVEQLGHIQLGRQRSPSKVGKANPTPYIRAANITERGIDLSDVLEMEFSDTEKETFALKVGDVLLTEASGSPEHVGRPAIWQRADGLFCFQNTVLRFTPEGIGSQFAFYSFLAMQKLGVFSRLSGGVGINHLSAGKFSRLPIPLPPLLEQGALVETLEESLARCDEQLSANSHALKQAAAQRQNILRAAFAGQLVPLEPEDEPASALLERIRASRTERAKQPKASKNKQQKEVAAVVRKLIEVLAEAGDWVSAQEAFRRCGVADGAETDEVEALYAELRGLDKVGRLAVEAVTDANGRKLHDRLKLLAG